MLEVTHLKRSYGNVVAVDDVNFRIGKGEIVGLLGHNGAGKTTIMKMLSGYLEPGEGSIKMDGVELRDNLKQAQQKIGYLPENLPIYPEMTVADYLDYAASLKGLQENEKHAEIKRVLSATNLTEKILAPIGTLSRGFKQRVGVAQAILGKPKLLILDEPTNGLDPSQTLQMRELICSIAKDATVILSTHIMQEVDAICDRVLMMRAGNLVIDARLEALRQSCELQIVTSPLSASVLQRLQQIDGVEKITAITREQELESYQVMLNEQAGVRSLGAALARGVITAGADLYQLHTEICDLETLFREINKTSINNKEEIRHAA